MAKKSDKKTRESQYRAVLSRYCVRLEDCRILAFDFGSTSGAIAFHYELLQSFPKLNYYFTDIVSETIGVVVQNKNDDCSGIVEAAKRCSGVSATISMR